jgi:hypothetical protein
LDEVAANMTFIAYAPEDIDTLLGEIDRLTEALRKVAEIQTAEVERLRATPEAGKPKCPTCGGSGDGERYDLSDSGSGRREACPACNGSGEAPAPGNGGPVK